VDNGRIWFHNVRVSRDALLDKYGQISADGKYKSAIEDRSVFFLITSLPSSQAIFLLMTVCVLCFCFFFD
jgi:hypothetical protein